jgi:bifunctional non-homologous end joining protein LigD
MPPPGFIAPQLATAREDVPAGDNWVHEIKFDGYRMLAYIDASGARLLSRNTLDWSRRFGQVTEALRHIHAKDAIIDGEVCVLDDRGRSDFHKLQAVVEEGRSARLSYLVFDLLRLNGDDLRELPLLKRKAQLQKLLPKRDRVIQYVDHFKGDAVKFFVGACEAGLEGIISKRVDAPYVCGRTTTWIKVKCIDVREFVVGGYIPSERRSFFKSLIVGEPSNEGLVFRGLVGGGFTEALGHKIAGMLAPLETDKSPFVSLQWEIRQEKPHWVKPEYIIQVRFTEITRDGVLRHPRFVRIRHISEPGVAEHLRSRTVIDKKPRRVRTPKKTPKPDRVALTRALRKSLGRKVRQ